MKNGFRAPVCNNIVSYEFLQIRRKCDYVQLNVYYYALFSSIRLRYFPLSLSLSQEIQGGFITNRVAQTETTTLSIHRIKSCY